MEIVIASSARKHGIGKRRILRLLADHQGSLDVTRPGDIDPKICFLAEGTDGVQWEVIAVVLPDVLLVIHAMPTRFRRSPLTGSTT